MKQAITIIYFSIGAVHLIAEMFALNELHRFTKPVLMPMLIYYILRYAGGHITLPRLLTGLALIFSWIGDVLLMNEQGEMYFMAGLGAFLAALITYTITLNQAGYESAKPAFKPVAPFLIYGALLLALLIPHAGNLTIPVTLYALGMLSMVSVARLRRWKTATESYKLALIGAVLFMLSDSLLAIDKFVWEFPLANFWVMLTYIPAQYLLVQGILKHPY